jgi:hypothetical protein
MMTTRQKSFRTLKAPVGAPDHFTIEQADAAVLAVMAERGETPVFEIVEPVDCEAGDRPQAHPHPPDDMRRRTPRNKRYPPILEPHCPPTHFTIEEMRRAVREVHEEDRLIAAEERRRRRAARRDAATRQPAP